MNPNYIQIGMRLSGSNGASAGQASFTNSSYYVGSNSYKQTNPGNPVVGYISAPPYGQWLVQPSTSNPGGDWITLIPTHSPDTSPGSCAAGTGHCYAVTGWYGSAIGAYTQISVVNLFCPASCGNTFIDNEMWFSDRHQTPNCSLSPYKSCWVEGGYSTFADGIWYYWADYPGDVGTYQEHKEMIVPANDFGQSMTVEILKDPNIANQYQIFLTSPNYYHMFTSDPVSMTQDSIEIGQETTARTLASAPQASFTQNQWKDQNGWHPQQVPNGGGNSYYSIDSPPSGGWYQYPSDSSTGGNWLTSCC
jgi:hypothetical protein